MTALGSVVSLPVAIERDDVLHFLGYPEGQKPFGRIAGLLSDTLREARRLVRPRGVFELLPTGRAGDLGLESFDATRLVAGLVTIGDGIESRSTELLRAGAVTEALLLDAAGSAAAEEAADRLGALIAGDNNEEAWDGLSRASHLSCRISPGYGKWPIAAQRALFDLLPHKALGVELMPTMLMVPRKSISFAMWLGADARPITGLSGCARCELEHCRYRRGNA
ncbi:MAG: hypothetical protein NDJ92_13785 [Thermoanaerobaculia bacterium]|nr:hypothetical protein [Thermoanaerobaculia bacterium]